jgi:type I restriction enzyme, S subunit
MSEVKKIPALRFPKFVGDWEQKQLEDITEKINSGKTPLGGESVYTNDGILFIRSQNVINNKLSIDNSTFISEEINNAMKNSVVKARDILLNITGASLGRSCVVPNNFTTGNVNQHVCIIRVNNRNEPHFIQPIFASRKGQNTFIRLQTGSGREGLNFQSIKKINLYIPAFSEQQKIASFLTTIDNKIQQLTKKKELLEQYKKGVMQKIFMQKIRFKDENGNEFPEWEEKKLNELLFETKKRNYDLKYNKNNVLSVSGKSGIVNQIEFQGRSFAGASVANYHIVEVGDIVYTKSPLKSNPYGIIKVNKSKAGIVSTLYAVYGCKETVSGEYLDYYFQLDDNTNRYLRPLVRKGAKNDMKINNAYVLSEWIKIPNKSQQLQIVSVLKCFDNKIEQVSTQLEQSKAFKKGLLQQMFV